MTTTTKKIVIFIDMDGVLADFDGALKERMHDPPEMFIPGFYRNLESMPGAYEAIASMLANPRYEIYIGSKPTTGNLYSTVEKYQWVAMHFPRLLKRIILTCDKNLLRGDVLIDDDLRWKDFPGTFLHFDRDNPEKAWMDVLCKLEEME